MDKIFKQFEAWYLTKRTAWEQNGVFADDAGLSKYGHQYWIKLHSDNGLGNIALYESNGFYWVDFEGGNYNYDVIFQKYGIEFKDIDELDIYEKEFIEYITRSRNVQ